MKETISSIEGNLHKRKLEQLTTSLIDAYRQEDDFTLKVAAGALRMDSEGLERKRLFYMLVKKLHPDRLEGLREEFRKAVENKDIDKLSGLKKLLDIRNGVREEHSRRFDFDYAEIFGAEADQSLGFGEDDESDWREEENNFINAIKREIFGNQNFSLDPSDLGQIDGVLNLQDYELDDLDGAEYCRNVRVLNIAGNCIFNIYDLQYLSQLEELYASGNNISDIGALSHLSSLEILDLSGNDIEDVSPLFQLPKLKFVDLRGNHLSDPIQIRDLRRLGILVVI